ncbi:Acetyltransferase (GNAT) domain-containing protein [Fontibacillus panacisegetis]|uniref:Acetyltransferase (GNAT) domain-containing protein n=1 Tax=Fontibacillus panacisegetis TaxID=670482 RepID=A0A1G7ER92_9BACL|nr:GNAT family N-acetyltransferase [Fontibacillus panacisegetis]SDE66174.1 Acetyltransferase (GNAT) domain-containing protein [Fontibacillus panacisegetis]
MKSITAICAKHANEVVRVLIFSYNAKCLSCMAVHPEHRRKGIATAMMKDMLSLFPSDVDISVTTFRENDSKGIAPRPLYKKFVLLKMSWLRNLIYHIKNLSCIERKQVKRPVH